MQFKNTIILKKYYRISSQEISSAEVVEKSGFVVGTDPKIPDLCIGLTTGTIRGEDLEWLHLNMHSQGYNSVTDYFNQYRPADNQLSSNSNFGRSTLEQMYPKILQNKKSTLQKQITSLEEAWANKEAYIEYKNKSIDPTWNTLQTRRAELQNLEQQIQSLEEQELPYQPSQSTNNRDFDSMDNSGNNISSKEKINVQIPSWVISFLRGDTPPNEHFVQTFCQSTPIMESLEQRFGKDSIHSIRDQIARNNEYHTPIVIPSTPNAQPEAPITLESHEMVKATVYEFRTGVDLATGKDGTSISTRFTGKYMCNSFPKEIIPKHINEAIEGSQLKIIESFYGINSIAIQNIEDKDNNKWSILFCATKFNEIYNGIIRSCTGYRYFAVESGNSDVLLEHIKGRNLDFMSELNQPIAMEKNYDTKNSKIEFNQLRSEIQAYIKNLEQDFTLPLIVSPDLNLTIEETKCIAESISNGNCRVAYKVSMVDNVNCFDIIVPVTLDNMNNLNIAKNSNKDKPKDIEGIQYIENFKRTVKSIGGSSFDKDSFDIKEIDILQNIFDKYTKYNNYRTNIQTKINSKVPNLEKNLENIDQELIKIEKILSEVFDGFGKIINGEIINRILIRYLLQPSLETEYKLKDFLAYVPKPKFWSKDSYRFYSNTLEMLNKLEKNTTGEFQLRIKKVKEELLATLKKLQ